MSQASMLQAGDIIMLDIHGPSSSDPPDGVYDHIQVVVGNGNTSTDPNDYVTCVNGVPIVPSSAPPSVNAVLIDQNCIDRKHVAWDYFVEPEAGKKFIHVID